MDISTRSGGPCKIAVPQLPRMANFDDLDPLISEPSVTVDIIAPGHALPGDADLVLIPGSKSTLADLAFLRAQSWDLDLKAHIRRGGQVLGLCGGYQMLGQTIADPNGVDGTPGTTQGLGLLDVNTTMASQKTVTQCQAKTIPGGYAVTGYEIHMGVTTGPDCARAWLAVKDRTEGAMSPDGTIRGSYLHGLFASDEFRAAFLAGLGHSSDAKYDSGVDDTLDDLADHLENHLDLDMILNMAKSHV